MTLLVVVAHPDDETFGCGSILMHARRRTRTAVVCLTRGDAGHPPEGVELPPGGLGQLRERELREAAGVLGVETVELLDLLDSGMSGPPPPGSLCGIPLEDLVATVRDAVERHRPTVVLTLAGSDGHRDHLRTRDAVLAATEPDLPVYLHCLPRSLMHEWLREQGGAESAAEYASLPEIGTPDEEVTTVIDSSWCYDQRRDAISRHRSQTSPFASISEGLRRRFLATDHLVRARPAWPGGPVEDDLCWPGEDGTDAAPVHHRTAARPHRGTGGILDA